MMLAVHATLRSPLDECLSKLGWRRLDYAAPLYQLGQGSDAARLESIALLGGGTRYRLDAPCIAPTVCGHLAANAPLAGPLKFIEEAGGGSACVADLPASVLAAASEFDLATSDSPLTCWAECITALLTGQWPAAEEESSASAQITKTLEAAGYTASLDGSGVKATLVLPGRFAEVSIERDQPGGLKLSFELANYGQSPETAATARLVATEINRRLLLARVSEPEPGVLVAEVRLTMSRVHEAWLLTAMESLAAAAGLALRPLAALQDPALAARLMSLIERG
jgi:hypothetical protein